MADEVVLDLTNYKDRFGSRVNPGRYRVFVEDAELDKTNNGKAMINVWFRIQGGPFDGATVIDRLLPEHEKALFRIVGFMQAIGQPTPKKRLRLNVRSFIGKVLDIDVEDGDPYNGNIRSEVRGYHRPEGLVDQRDNETDLEDLEGLGVPDRAEAEALELKDDRGNVMNAKPAEEDPLAENGLAADPAQGVPAKADGDDDETEVVLEELDL